MKQELRHQAPESGRRFPAPIVLSWTSILQPFFAPAERIFNPAPWALGVLLGTAWQLQQAQLWPAAVYVAVLALALLALVFWWRVQSVGRRALLALCAAMLVAMGQAGWRSAAFAEQSLKPHLEGRDIVVTGRIDRSAPRGMDAVRFHLAVERAELEGQPVPLPPLVALSWYASRQGAPRAATAPTEEPDATEEEAERERMADQARREPQHLQAGELWRMTVRLKAPHGQSNPHGFDQELRLWEQGVQALGYVRTAVRHAAPQRLAQAQGHWIERARQATRDAIARQVSSPSQAGVIAALVMGEQQAIERADWDVFRATGVAHLMSISGLHITLFAWLAGALLTALWRASVHWSPAWCLALPAHVAGAWGGVMLAAAYALYAGWAVPAQRTVWMLLIVVGLRQWARSWPWPQVWVFTMAVVLLIDPWAWMQAGFWLSFVAVALLFTVDRPGEALRPLAWSLPGLRTALVRAFGALLRLLREQWVITLALAPLTLWLFQQVSLVGLLANVLAIPWVTLVVTPLSLLGVLWAPVWSLSAWALEGLLAVLTPLSHLPWAILERAAAPWWCALAALLGGLLLVMPWPLALRLLGLPLLLPVLLWQNPRPPPGQFELLAFDVGQGSAVLIRTASHSLLYDAGPRYGRESDAGHRVLVPALRALGERPDLLVLSHSDTDHMGGAGAVLAWQPATAVTSSLPLDHPLLQGLPAHRPCRAGQRWHWDGVTFELLHPTEEAAVRLRKPNDRSCVLRVLGSPGQGAALLTGDLEAQQEADLARRSDLRADLLMAPHHGSRTSSSATLLEAVQARVVVVQAGYRNRFGHPAAEVVARYRQAQIRVVQTVHCGALIWRSSAPQDMHCQRDQSPRYWHHRPPHSPP
jgi:competence protein ComEC